MAKDDKHFRLRMPAHLKKKVEEAAKEHGQSMTAEINSRVETSFMIAKPEQYQGATPELVSLIRTIVMETITLLDEQKKR